jgi:DNA-binding beta-propeller fold protein YncE
MKIHILGILLFFSTLLSGQDSDSCNIDKSVDDPYIRWITSLPSNDTPNKSGFFEMLFNFIVGNESVIFNMPVNVSASGLENYWIINQGGGSILHYQDGKVRKAPVFKKIDDEFPSLVGICSMGTEGLLFTDSRLNKIFILTSDGKKFRSLNDSIRLDRPTGIAYSENTSEIWIIETGSHCISVLNKKGEKIKTIGKRGNGPLEFNFPTYIWIDGSGNIYIVDSMNFRIQVLSPEGAFITSFGQQGDATGYFARPRGIATDSRGNIYVMDALFNVIQVFDISGKFLYYLGSQGNGKYQFWMPSGIFIDKSDYMYISDSYNGRVQIFQILNNPQK